MACILGKGVLPIQGKSNYTLNQSVEIGKYFALSARGANSGLQLHLDPVCQAVGETLLAPLSFPWHTCSYIICSKNPTIIGQAAEPFQYNASEPKAESLCRPRGSTAVKSVESQWDSSRAGILSWRKGVRLGYDSGRKGLLGGMACPHPGRDSRLLGCKAMSTEQRLASDGRSVL